MMHVVRDPPAGDPSAPEQRLSAPATALPESQPPSLKAMTPHDGASFAAGQDCGTRVAACIARLSALELIDGSRWWNRRGHRLMAGALVAYAEELESAADARTGFHPLPGTRKPGLEEAGLSLDRSAP